MQTFQNGDMMSKKIAYERVYCRYGRLSDMNKVELTGRCKRVNDNGCVREYAEVQRRLLGVPLGTRWVAKDYIELRDEPIIEYYKCDLTSK